MKELAQVLPASAKAGQGLEQESRGTGHTKPLPTSSFPPAGPAPLSQAGKLAVTSTSSLALFLPPLITKTSIPSAIKDCRWPHHCLVPITSGQRAQAELLRSPFHQPRPHSSSFHMPSSCCSSVRPLATAPLSHWVKILLPNTPNPQEPVSPTPAQLVSAYVPPPPLLDNLPSAPSLDLCPYRSPPLASLPFSPVPYPVGPSRLCPRPPPQGHLP